MDIMPFIKDYQAALARYDSAEATYIEVAGYDVIIAKAKLNAAIAEAKGKSEPTVNVVLPWLKGGENDARTSQAFVR